MFRPRFLIPAFAAIVGLAAHSSAAPVNYSEAIDGDLSDFSVPLQTFMLDVGANIVSGTLGTAANGAPDFDSFAFVVPAGMELYYGRVQAADADVGDIISASWRLQAGSTNFNGGTFINFVGVGAPGTSFINDAPLSAGSYNFSAASYVHPEVPLPARAEFTFTLRVREEVPEPGLAGLVMLAFAALVARRGRMSV